MNDEQQIWYGLCTYWTDDWDALKPTPENKGIPSCPECGSVGFQMTRQEWNEGVAKYEADGNPGYTHFINNVKGNCMGKTTLLEAWERQKEVQKDEDAEISREVENEENAPEEE
jgi:hypothetical protein